MVALSCKSPKNNKKQAQFKSIECHKIFGDIACYKAVKRVVLPCVCDKLVDDQKKRQGGTFMCGLLMCKLELLKALTPKL